MKTATKCVVSLERITNDDILSYKTIVTNTKGTPIGNYKFESENYDQALLVAKLFYEEFKQKFSRLIVGSYIEQPHCLHYQGALYSESEFATPDVSTDSFYRELEEEFIDNVEKDKVADVNLIFRVVVANHKLNLYQERKLLERLKEHNIVSSRSKKRVIHSIDKLKEYRQKILDQYDIDIVYYQDQLIGGKADGKKITDYDLDQLVMGIKVETEHTTDKLKALEISMDHLEEIPDYYTRLKKMEEDAGVED